uniref:Secreted protein n=1 Tax=Haemonchus placei TaxID=6290 RepID=A0A0N4WVQ6_HAEPC
LSDLALVIRILPSSTLAIRFSTPSEVLHEILIALGAEVLGAPFTSILLSTTMTSSKRFEGRPICFRVLSTSSLCAGQSGFEISRM